jgi:hypothetical protein
MQNITVNLSKFVIHSEASLVFASDQGNLQRSVLQLLILALLATLKKIITTVKLGYNKLGC